MFFYMRHTISNIYVSMYRDGVCNACKSYKMDIVRMLNTQHLVFHRLLNRSHRQLTMASIIFYQFYCRCGQFLFNSCDIFDSNKDYIFVEENFIKLKIFLTSTSVKCEICSSNLGGIVYRYPNLSNLVRFSRRALEREKNYLDIYRVIDEDGAIIHGEYELMLTGYKNN